MPGGPEPTVAAPARPHVQARAAIKRAFDVAVALVTLVALSPLIAALAAWIKLDTPGPVLYRAQRVGRGGRPFGMLKFRKMVVDAAGPALTAHEDARFTPAGVWLARLKLDELPQLVDVLRGTMSLVGPRPEDLRFVAMFPEAYAEILTVRPGITGLSQLAFAEESRILDRADPTRHYVERILPQKVEMDVLYARRHGFLLDCRILLWSIATVVLRRPVAVHRATGAMSFRHRRPGVRVA